MLERCRLGYTESLLRSWVRGEEWVCKIGWLWSRVGAAGLDGVSRSSLRRTGARVAIAYRSNKAAARRTLRLLQAGGADCVAVGDRH